MKEHHFKRSKLSKIMTFTTYGILDAWIKKGSKTPYPLSVKDYFYSNTGHREYLSKFIESVIMKILKADGYDPIKAPDSGKRIDKRKVVIDVIGRSRIIGSAQWVKDSKVMPGRADIKCFFNGKMYNLEVKVGNDRMSQAQIRERERCAEHGEEYVIIRTVEDFLGLYLTNEK